MKCKLPKPAQISPNLRFCFIKRVPRKTLIEVLWLRVILDLNLSNWELYGASWWIIWFSFHFVIYGWSSPWAGRVPQLTRPTAAWTSRPLWSTDRHTASTVLIQGRRKGWKPGGTSRNPRHFEGKGFGKIWVPRPLASLLVPTALYYVKHVGHVLGAWYQEFIKQGENMGARVGFEQHLKWGSYRAGAMLLAS